MSQTDKSRLQIAIESAKKQGRTALIPFITAGFPDMDRFWEELQAIDQAGADIIEIGVPFSDPVADGPVIENASRDALARGVTLAWILDGLKQRAGQYKAQLVLMGYINPFMQYGYEKLAKDAHQAGVAGFIIPDVILEESQEIRQALAPYDIDVITLVAPNTSLERMKEYAQSARGFVYVVSVLGTTGGTVDLADSVTNTLSRAREAFDIPLALGFGLKEPSQLDVLPSDMRPDAAVFGSALLRHIEEGKPVTSFLAPWL